jgi:hypothetical protein
MHLSSSPMMGFVFGESLAPTNPSPYRYQYPACPYNRDHPSSLIQVVGFSERPFIVPHEVLKSLNVGARALSPKQKTFSLSSDTQD